MNENKQDKSSTAQFAFVLLKLSWRAGKNELKKHRKDATFGLATLR